jgi:hypothetical protein
VGDFDGTSAFELLDVLTENLEDLNRVCIITDNLRKIYPFGQEVFENNIYQLKKNPFFITFLGKNARQIAPIETGYWCKIRISWGK